METIAKSLTSRWWLPVVDGILAIVFGILAWVWPGATITTLVILFGAYAFVSGLVNFGAAFDARKLGHSPWYFILRGVVGVAAGVAVVVWPDISALALLYVIASFAIATGIIEIAAAIGLRKLIDNEWLLALAGLGSIAFGVLVAIFPGDGALALVWTIGVYAIFAGIMLIGLGVRLHSLGERFTSRTTSRTA